MYTQQVARPSKTPPGLSELKPEPSQPAAAPLSSPSTERSGWEEPDGWCTHHYASFPLNSQTDNGFPLCRGENRGPRFQKSPEVPGSQFSVRTT